jgi:hypothetical protein
MAELLTSEQSDALAQFLRSQASKRFRWGSVDCGLFLADWLMAARRLPDAAAEFRGRYDTEAACTEITSGRPLVEIVDELTEKVGITRSSAPIDGDLGVLKIPAAGETGAIMTRGSWAFRTQHGLAWSKVAPGRVLATWGVFHD